MSFRLVSNSIHLLSESKHSNNFLCLLQVISFSGSALCFSAGCIIIHKLPSVQLEFHFWPIIRCRVCRLFFIFSPFSVLLLLYEHCYWTATLHPVSAPTSAYEEIEMFPSEVWNKLIYLAKFQQFMPQLHYCIALIYREDLVIDYLQDKCKKNIIKKKKSEKWQAPETFSTTWILKLNTLMF